MAKTKVVYLASPYSHMEESVKDYRAYQIDCIMARLYKKHKIAFIPPILISVKIKEIIGESIGTSFKDWKNVDLAYIDHSDEVWVVLMDGWKESIGVQAEIKYATKTNKKIKYINAKTLKFTRKPKYETA